MPSLSDTPLRDVLGALASAAPAPGGGSASAVAAAMGASLLMMVAGLPKTRWGREEDRAALTAAAVALTGIQQQLTEAIDADVAAYDQVLAAYRLPKATEGDRDARQAAVQRTLRMATEVPLGVMRSSALALEHAVTVAQHGYRPAASDVGVAVALLGAGIHGARLNVEVNLASLSDRVYVDAVRANVERLTADAARAAPAVQERLQG